jgi:pantoate--beta-alanine ligase
MSEMQVARSVDELRALLAPLRAESSIGFVPTMGALHDGHMSLVTLARDAADVCVLSIFVNPLQFGPTEDLERYPRPIEADLERARATGVDVVFLPSVEEMYPDGATTTVVPGAVADVLEGAHRPGHFSGVATVVAKLFNIVEPDVAVFGQKDAQQVAVIQAMVRDLDFKVRIDVGPTIREPDGLAMSSRNRYLDIEQRQRALALHEALRAGGAALQAGGSPPDAEEQMLKVLDEAGLETDYASAVDPLNLSTPGPGDVLLLVAARVGSTRLIDNMLVKASQRGTS